MIARTTIVAAIALCLGFAAFLAVSRTTANPHEDSAAESPVQRTELLRAPGFDDVSAFDNNDIADRRLAASTSCACPVPEFERRGRTRRQDCLPGFFRVSGLEVRRKATPETSYHVASVTKAFTALLAVTLHDRGVVDLDQPV